MTQKTWLKSSLVTKKTPNDDPYYVIERDLKKNTITVAHKSAADGLSIEKKEFSLESTNWIGTTPQSGKTYTARIRHLGQLLPCTIEAASDGAEIGFKEPLIVAAGQSVVVYDGPLCMGGGIVMV